MRIATLKTDETDELAKLAKTIWHECFVDIISYEQIEYMTDMFLSTDAIKENIRKGYLYRIVYEKEKMIGFTASVNESERTFLSKLYLLKEYRGKGYGRKLIEDVHENMKLERMYLTVNKHNKAYDMYLHLGFEVIDSVITDIGNNMVMDDYVMEKKF